MHEINVKIKQGHDEYGVFIGSSLSGMAAEHVKKYQRKVVITDDNIKKHHSAFIFGLSADDVISVRPGEKSKSREEKKKIEDYLLKRGYGRDSLVIAVGGGVVGDLAGFVSGTYNRGIPFINIPTTLLSMCDASIGGKTGINTMHGKNLIGCIWQPKAVFIDTDFLKTLAQDELLSGMAEVIKMAIILDRDFFDFLYKNHGKIMDRDEKTIMKIIKRSVELKIDVVEHDARESSKRQILNFGHTVGHALEKCKDYEKKHGFCVSRGMVAESKMSNMLNILSDEDMHMITDIIKRFGLPADISGCETQRLIDIMKRDKKSVGQKPRFVLLNRIGEVKSDMQQYSFEIDQDIIKRVLS